MVLSNEAFIVLAESDEAHAHNWSDISQLNYWARKIGFQMMDANTGRLLEIGFKRGDCL